MLDPDLPAVVTTPMVDAGDVLDTEIVERMAFLLLPEDARARVALSGMGPEFIDPVLDTAGTPVDPEGLELALLVTSEDTYKKMSPMYRGLLVGLIEERLDGKTPRGLCFAPGTDPEIVEAFNQAMFGQIGLRFQPVSRWLGTTLTPGASNQGDPTTITYGFVPDGTLTEGLQPNPSTPPPVLPSDLRAFLDGIYGSQASWQPLFDGVFARWAELTGLSYVFEPNDDGSAIGSGAPGVAGVRADVRIAGVFLDGNSGVLAYNIFPQVGDMVFDTGDGFYSNTSGGSIRLRNVISHEHGHGIGIAHVCPADSTKLMEPFINLNFDGPQFDDILTAQRLYGDPLEPNDSITLATDLGDIGETPETLQLVSTDDNSDLDIYRIGVLSPRDVTITLRPIGPIYLEGPQDPQTGNCTPGTAFDASSASDLRLDLLNVSGVVLSSSDVNPAGASETITQTINSPGDYYIRVVPGSSNIIQRYELDYVSVPISPEVLISFPGGVPQTVSTQDPTTFEVRVDAVSDTVLPGSELLAYRYDGGFFVAVPLTGLGGGLYEATLPSAACGETSEFYIQASGALAGVTTSPSAGPNGPYTPIIVDPGQTQVFADDFETDRGWTTDSTALGSPFDGQWERGLPVGNNRGDPSIDADGTGRCYLTDNDPSDTNSDVDGGIVRLISPVFDLTSYARAVASFSVWFNTSVGDSPFEDVFDVDVSADGGANWTNAIRIGPGGGAVSGGWFTYEVELDGAELTDQVRFRFVASDQGGGSIVEAGVDAFLLVGQECEVQAVACIADFNNDTFVTVGDILDYLGAWSNSDLTADTNDDEVLTVGDILDFLSLWSAGCP